MSERHALLAAIAAEPDDDLPRLVYADWLEERQECDYGWVCARHPNLPEFHKNEDGSNRSSSKPSPKMRALFLKKIAETAA